MTDKKTDALKLARVALEGHKSILGLKGKNIDSKALAAIDEALAEQPAQPWVGLTDEDIRPMCKQDWVFNTVKQWAQIIEAKLREKNA